MAAAAERTTVMPRRRWLGALIGAAAVLAAGLAWPWPAVDHAPVGSIRGAAASTIRLRAPQAGYPAPVLDYRFRDGSGTSVADSSGAGRTGTVYGDATWDASGLTLAATSYVLVPATLAGLGVGSAGTIAVHGSVSAASPAIMVSQTTSGGAYDLMMGYRSGGNADLWYGVGVGGLSAGGYSTAAISRIVRWGGGTIGYRAGAGAEGTAATSGSPGNSSGAQLRIGMGLSWGAAGTRMLRRVTIWSVRISDAQIAAWKAEL